MWRGGRDRARSGSLSALGEVLEVWKRAARVGDAGSACGRVSGIAAAQRLPDVPADVSPTLPDCEDGMSDRTYVLDRIVYHREDLWPDWMVVALKDGRLVRGSVSGDLFVVLGGRQEYVRPASTLVDWVPEIGVRLPGVV